MANIFKPLRTGTASLVPTTTHLADGELGINYTDKKLYIRIGASIIELFKTLVKSDVGLGNVDNTSDANKPVSTATQTALNLKANDADVIKLAGAQNITGPKTISFGVGGTEGGEFYIAKPASGTSMTGNVIVDVYVNSVRFYAANATGAGLGGIDFSFGALSGIATAWHSSNFTPSLYATLAGPVFTGLMIMPGAYWSAINLNTLNAAYEVNALANMWINYRGYNDGITQFRDFLIGDGKAGQVAKFQGSDKSLNVAGPLQEAGQQVWHSGNYKAPSTVVLAADVANSSTTIANVTGLTFTVPIGKTYRFRAQIVFEAANSATNGSLWTIAVSGTGNTKIFRSESPNVQTAHTRYFNENLDFDDAGIVSNSSGSSSANNIGVVEGVVTAAAVAAVVQIRFNNKISTSAITAKAGVSFLEYVPLN